MSKTWDVCYNILLISSSIYGLTRSSLRSKKLAIIALFLYCTSGWLGLASSVTDNETIQDVDNLFYGISNTAGVDLFVAEVCLTSGVDKTLSCLILVPPCLDLFMRYVTLISMIEYSYKLDEDFATSLLRDSYESFHYDLTLPRYVVNAQWTLVTPLTHILSVALLFNFAIRDSRPILIVSGMAFLFAVITGRHDYYDDVTGYNAIAVFCTTWFLEGKDFKEFGF